MELKGRFTVSHVRYEHDRHTEIRNIQVFTSIYPEDLTQCIRWIVASSLFENDSDAVMIEWEK